MIRGDLGESILWQPHLVDLHARALVIDVIEVEQREEAGIGAAVAQMRPEIDAVELLREDIGRQRAGPFVEIAEHDLRAGDPAVVDDVCQPHRLIAALEQRGAQMHVVEVQDVFVGDLEIDALDEARLTGLPAEVLLLMVLDGEVAQYDVAK
jgi:hypothetical protein